MSTPERTVSKSSSKRRSRGGCERCRRRRQKCDEAQPACSRCSEAKTQCMYQMQIRWGGRDFSRSSFGTCGAQKIEMEPGKFVYGAKDGRAVRSPKPEVVAAADITGIAYANASLRTNPKIARVDLAVGVPRTLPELPDMDPQVWATLHYFVHKGSAAISTHRQIQEEACGALIPAALAAPALLHAISAFAAAQQATYAQDAHDRMRLNMHELQSRMRSIQILQKGMAGGEATSPAVVLGSSLMLCLCTLYGGNDDYGSWRIYLRGARAAFAASWARGGGKNRNDPLARYLRKRYNLLEVLAMLSTNSFEALELGGADDDDEPSEPSESAEVFFNDHVSCYTDLFNLLRVIGAVAWERRQRTASHVLSEADFDAEADNLEAEVRRMMARNRRSPLVLRPSVRAVLEPAQIDEFTLSNEVHEHYALLQIRAEIRGWGSDDARVQQPVQEILKLATRMQLRSGLSPALGLNTPLFSAGQHAVTPEQQAVVRSLLEGLYAKTHNRNLLLAVRRLEADYWAPPLAQDGARRLPCPDFIAY